MPKQWTSPTPAPEQLRFALPDVSPGIVQILFNRGLQTAEEIRRFLTPDPARDLGDPFAIKDMDVAVGRIRQAIVGGEQIAVYADFDVDGICSAALLTQVIESMGAHVRVYIPHRVDEGYGLNKGAIDSLAADGVRLLITADCGTSSISEVAYACGLGVDVIVTDHHHVHNRLPDAVAVLNPQRADSHYVFRELAGVGVAYKLAEALVRQSAAAVPVRDYLDLVALGTVVDVAPLVGENRALVRMGLDAMRRAPRPGLRALMRVSRIKPETLDTGNLGFGLGPRLNAAGRIDTARTSYDLLLSQSDAEAEPLALKLEDLNLERQKRLETALVSARETASGQAEGGRLIFVASADYQAGIVGLVASRLVDEFYRPAIAIERGEELSRGSCRSVPEFQIARALDECADLLVRHGGHAMAAGFTVRTERLAELQEKLAAIAQRDLGERALEPTLAVDCQIALSSATWETRAKLSQLAPFGAGNPTPLLRSNNVRVRSVQLVRGDSVQLKLTNGSAETWDAIAFRQSHIAQMVHAGDRIDIVYNLEDRTWNGESTIQLVIKDARKR